MQNRQLKRQPKGEYSESGHAEVSREWLVRGAMRGGKEALQDLCKSVAQDVLFSTSRILNNRSDAEDAAQEILVRLCMGIRDLHEPKAFDAWLGRITTNESRRIMMKNYKYDNVVSISDYIEVIQEDNEDFLPHGCAIRQEDRRMVLEIVDRLPERQREAITLHYYNGLSVMETAEAMDVKHQVVSRYLKLAREKIKEELSEKEGGEWASTRGLAFMPVGSLLSLAMHQESGVAALSNSAWIQQALTNASAFAGGSAKSGAASAGLAKAAAAVLVTGAISVGTWVGVANMGPAEEIPPPTPSPPPVVQMLEYAIVFSGGNESATQINPREAVAYADSDHGEMTALYWWIESEGEGGDTVFAGRGSVVEKELARLYDEGKDGDYTLYFKMEDAAGDTYTLTRQFTIQL